MGGNFDAHSVSEYNGQQSILSMVIVIFNVRTYLNTNGLFARAINRIRLIVVYINDRAKRMKKIFRS